MPATLDQLTEGQSALVQSLDCDSLNLRKHLLDMGLTVGTVVTCVKDGGSVLEIRLRGFSMAIRKEDVARVSVAEVTSDAPAPRPAPEGRPQVEKLQHPRIGESQANKDLPQVEAERPVTLALIGNKNGGKTTLFNQVTGANQRTEIFEGVEGSYKCGGVHGYSDVKIIDLPGVYALSHFSQEEVMARDLILDVKPDCIVNIVDASNIQRNLYLTTQLLSMDIPVVIALNMMDEVQANGGSIDVNLLESYLGVPVVPISALKNQGLDELLEHAVFVARHKLRPRPGLAAGWEDPQSGPARRCIASVQGVVAEGAHAAGISPQFAAVAAIEGDLELCGRLGLSEAQLGLVDEIAKAAEQETGKDRLTLLSEMRFGFIDALYSWTVVYPSNSIESRRSRLIDRVLTGKYTAVPAFICIMGLVFYATFGPIGTWLCDTLALGIEWIVGLIDGALTAYGVNPVVHSLVVDGALAGVGSIMEFLPIIVVLFFFLALLEDSGYIARVAFVMDSLLRKIGLSGRSIIPLLVGFGCSAPAIMATRSLPSERDRRMTVMLIPFMSCSAKLPVYALFVSVFFPAHGALVMMALYFGGILVGILFALIMKKTAFRGEPVPFVMELPNYRVPAPKNVLQIISEQVKEFIVRVFTVVFVASVIIWFLQSFDARLNIVDDSSASLLAAIGGILAPVFAPLGLGDWRVVTALVSGFTAKECVLSTLLVMVGGIEAGIASIFTPATAVVFLTFFLLYTPCVSAIAMAARELGGKWGAGLVLMQCCIAWVVSFAVSLLLRLMGLL